MKRRSFIGAATGIAAGALAAPALAAGSRRFRLMSKWADGTPGFSDAALRFQAQVAALSDGKLTVEIKAAGAGVSPFDAVQSGAADMYHGMESAWRGKLPIFDAFTGLPFGMTAGEHDAWLAEGGGQKLWDELSGAFGLKCLICGNTGGQMGGWFRAEIASLDGFRGRKIHADGIAADVLKRVGAVPVSLPAGSFKDALGSLAVDGIAWIGPWHDMALGLHAATKFYYYPAFHSPSAALSLGINRKLWNGLGADVRAIIEAAAAVAHGATKAEFDAKNAEALQHLRFREGVKALKLPDDVLEALGAASGQTVREMASSGDKLTKTIIDSYIGYRGKAIAWSRVSEQAFRNARLLAFEY